MTRNGSPAAGVTVRARVAPAVTGRGPETRTRKPGGPGSAAASPSHRSRNSADEAPLLTASVLPDSESKLPSESVTVQVVTVTVT